MLYACFAPDWLGGKSVQTESLEEALSLNERGYNVFWYPNYPTVNPGRWVESADVDNFEWVFVDMDLKDGVYVDKVEFLNRLGHTAPLPTWVVDTGNGIHAYWRVSDLDAMSFLRLSRRLMRLHKTDDAVQKLKQCMRLPGTDNTKEEGNYRPCKELNYGESLVYTCEVLDRVLPPITMEDEAYCQAHYNKAHAIQEELRIEEKLPTKFGELLNKSKEVAKIFAGDVPDRSVGDMRLGHILFANKFTREEAMSVLVNVPKALERGPVHRVNYAQNIVEKIWTFEATKEFKGLSRSVRDILSAPTDVVEGVRFPCWDWLDGTEYGFRLGHVVGLVAGVGVGKTSMALNMFLGYVQLNPSFTHFFCSLEQPVEEIARRWRKMCGDDTSLYDKVHIIGNYNEDGSFRHLSLGEIKDYILAFQKQTGKKVGCCVIDHLAILKMKDGNGENQRIVDLCHELKPFAIETGTLLVMQSQAPREKAGIGDLELNKDASYGSVLYESYCDALITIWQPVKKAYEDGAPLVTAYKFCKIRHKNVLLDRIKEDVPYTLIFDPETEHYRHLTQMETESFKFHLKKVTEKRKEDRKTSLVEYTSLGAKK